MVRSVIFDLDGTLVNTIEDLTDSMNQALQVVGLQGHTPELCLGMIGSGKRNFVKMACGDGNERFVEEVLALFRKFYHEICLNKTYIYEGINDVLKDLAVRNMKLGVLTNKDHSVACKVVGHYFPKIFEITQGASDGIALKPEPGSLKSLLNKFGVTADEVIYVGDSDVDVLTGKNTGVYTVAVSWGFREKSFLQQFGPNAIIDEPAELLELVEKK